METSMYDIIMSLSLFKGMTCENVSSFLEKTPVEFHNYKEGEAILSSGDRIESLKCVISGKISIIHKVGGIDLTETDGQGRMLDAMRLFGINTECLSDVVAETAVCVMEFSKERYFSLLKTDSILLINFLNYLSMRAQRGVDTLLGDTPDTVENILRRMKQTLCERSAEKVLLNCDILQLAALLNMPYEKMKTELDRLVNDGRILVSEEGIEFSRL